ncbi:MAG: carboxypeptidase regulatory-like domain-containing protein [Pseudomonadota bacterium]
MLKRTALALGVMAAMTAGAPVFAQSTSAALTGRITDPAGAPLAGATVEIVHVPSGSRRTVTTDSAGRFNAAGLRVGGPYTVSSSAAGRRSVEQGEVFLNLDEVNSLTLSLAPEQMLEAVEVTATAATLTFSPDNMGARTNITRAEIEAFPSINRQIQDYVRFDPRVVVNDKARGSISAAGQNERFNNIKIDGVPTNDQFGLNASGLPSLNQPISIDWIEEFNVGISNFDVTQADATGANINAVTKSGGNEFSGAVYGTYRNNDMVSDEPTEFLGFDDEWTAGAYVSGPIIEDTLFFFVGYEEFERSSPGPSVTIGTGNVATDVRGLTQADLDRIASIARGFGLDPGNPGDIPDRVNSDEKVIAKLDWNINDQHRAMFRYNKTDAAEQILPNFGLSAYSFPSNWYTQEIKFENYVAALYSNWNDVFSTELNVSYSEYDSQPIFATRAPAVRVGVNNNTTGVFFGTERSRHANLLGVDTLTAFFAGDLFLGDHTVRFGFDYEANDVFNLFAQDVFGAYNFTSIDNFAARNFAASGSPFGGVGYRLQFPISGDINSAAAQFELATLGLFVQDTWAVNANLTLTYGLRVDELLADEEPAFNAPALAAFGFDNTVSADGETTVQPRIGFNYTFDSERPTQLRGGVGLFQGSGPLVWLSNTYSNPGVLTRVLPVSSGTGFSANPDDPLRPTGTPPASLVDILAPDFGQPTVWKMNLAFEHELPWYGLVASAEWLRTVVEKGIVYQNLNLGAPTGVLPDGRLSYWTTLATTGFGATGPTSTNQNRTNRNRNFDNVLLLSNTGSGAATNLTLALEKPFSDDWGAKVAYTFGRSTDVNPGTSSVAFSNYLNRAVFNPNDVEEGTSIYETRDRFQGALTQRFRFVQDYPTTIGLVYDGREGRPFSFTFVGDANGDSINGNDLFAIPNLANIAYSGNSTAADRAAFERFVREVPGLNDNQGTVAERNSQNSPNVNQFDLRITQDLPGFFGDNRAQVFVDIQNIGNLINKDWGQIDEVGFPYNMQIARFAGVDASGRVVYDVANFVNEANGTETFPRPGRRDGVAESRWNIQVGFRYEF